MNIGIPCETKPWEGRVALVPEACADLVAAGHRVRVEQGAGVASGFSDAAYVQAGAEIVSEAQTLYARSDLVVKVKEPIGAEPDWLRAGQILFCFLHLAAMPELAERLAASGVTAIAFETVREADGRLPILQPMSWIAGRLAVIQGLRYLQRQEGGRGLLLGGVPGVERGRVTVVGGGNVGGQAARLAAALGATVTVLDKDARKLEALERAAPNLSALYPYGRTLERAVAEADLLVGAVLVPGARAPRVVSRAQVAAMAAGSVAVDVAVDQGGCLETTRPTSYDDPVYVAEGVTHFAVTNMPGAVPRSASLALCAALLPWVRRLAETDWRSQPVLSEAVNVDRGEVLPGPWRKA